MGNTYDVTLVLQAYVYADSITDAREAAWEYWSDNYSEIVNFKYVDAEPAPKVSREDCDRDVSNEEESD